MTFEEQDYNLSFFNRIRTNFILNKESIDKIVIIFSKNFRSSIFGNLDDKRVNIHRISQE